jgi:hypothetical protein
MAKKSFPVQYNHLSWLLHGFAKTFNGLGIDSFHTTWCYVKCWDVMLKWSKSEFRITHNEMKRFHAQKQLWSLLIEYSFPKTIISSLRSYKNANWFILSIFYVALRIMNETIMHITLVGKKYKNNLTGIDCW